MEASQPDADRLAQDQMVLELRSKGHSFGAIARKVGIPSAPLALEAFNRALRTHPADVQERIRREEDARLDALAEHVRSDTSLDAETIEKRLRVIDRMRGALRAA